MIQNSFSAWKAGSWEPAFWTVFPLQNAQGSPWTLHWIDPSCSQICNQRSLIKCHLLCIKYTFHCLFFFLCLFFFFGLRASQLQSRRSTTWATPPVHFTLGILVSQTICLGWSWITILLISSSQVARITDMSHCCPAHFPLFMSPFLGLILQLHLSRYTRRKEVETGHLLLFCMCGTGVWI
jgi:hypothetical protein